MLALVIDDSRALRMILKRTLLVRALAAGAHEHVLKPFTAEAIADQLTLLGLTPSRVTA